MTDVAEKAAKLIAQGYRRTSNRYLMVSRVDRSDWVQVLAKNLGRAPADFYVPGESKPAANWADYYRRVYSKDTLKLTCSEIFKLIPGSGWDNVGYVEVGQ